MCGKVFRSTYCFKVCFQVDTKLKIRKLFNSTDANVGERKDNDKRYEKIK